MGGMCEGSCIDFVVQRCQYCVGDSDTLELLVKVYGIQTNWLRLWTLNSDQDAALKEREEVRWHSCVCCRVDNAV